MLVYEKMSDREKPDSCLNYNELNDVYLQAQNLENTMNEIYGLSSRNADELASMLQSSNDDVQPTDGKKQSNGESNFEPLQRMIDLRKSLSLDNIYIYDCQVC